MIYIASDHAGFQLKKALVSYLENQLKMEFEDLGPATYVETDDFPDYAIPLAQVVAKDKNNRGILICSSGLGMCITANKVKGAYAIVGYNIGAAEMGRRHNNANIICLAAKVLSGEHASAIVKKFLETNFEGAKRLERRNKKIEALEK